MQVYKEGEKNIYKNINKKGIQKYGTPCKSVKPNVFKSAEMFWESIYG